jgi:excisionase family DNA binding protein
VTRAARLPDRAPVFTPEQVAERWGCSANHVRNLIKRGELRAFRLGHRLIRVPLDAIEEYEQCQIIGSDGSKDDSSSPGGATTESGDVIVLTHSRERKPRPRPSTESGESEPRPPQQP